MSKADPKEYYVIVTVPSIVVHKGSRSHSRPESPTVVVVGGMPSLPSCRQGFVIGGPNASYQSNSESDMIDGNANPNVGSSPSLHRTLPSCPSDKTDTENKNFRNRVCFTSSWHSSKVKCQCILIDETCRCKPLSIVANELDACPTMLVGA